MKKYLLLLLPTIWSSFVPCARGQDIELACVFSNIEFPQLGMTLSPEDEYIAFNDLADAGENCAAEGVVECITTPNVILAIPRKIEQMRTWSVGETRFEAEEHRSSILGIDVTGFLVRIDPPRVVDSFLVDQERGIFAIHVQSGGSDSVWLLLRQECGYWADSCKPCSGAAKAE